VGIRAIKVIHYGQESADYFGNHSFTICLAIPLHTHAEVLELSLGSCGTVTVFRHQVTLRFGKQLDILLGDVVP
jgi:hypothetical protein